MSKNLEKWPKMAKFEKKGLFPGISPE